MTTVYLIGNWKQHGSRASIAAFASQWSFEGHEQLAVAIAPPFPYIGELGATLPDCLLAAQDCSIQEQGAHTGEVSAGMLADVGCRFVLVGHSERRVHHGETDELIGRKLAAVQAAGLTPVLCVGEDSAMRQAGEQNHAVRGQLRGALSGMASSVLIAYEPVWAIGTGLTATPDQVNDMHAVIKAEVNAVLGGDSDVPVLYGGSVNPETAPAVLGCPHVDGALVGGASLDPGAFADIARSALNSLSY